MLQVSYIACEFLGACGLSTPEFDYKVFRTFCFRLHMTYVTSLIRLKFWQGNVSGN